MRRGAWIALAALAFVAVVLATAAAAFFAGLEISAEFLRPPLERTLSAAFGVPVRIEGPLKLRTGLNATVSADALVLADPSSPAGAELARGSRPAARIDVVALLRRAVVAIDEVTGERLELTLLRRADGRANWASLFTPSAGEGQATFSFAGIERLHIGKVAGSYLREGGAPVQFAIAPFEGELPLHKPISARGSAQVADQSIGFDLRSASLSDFARRPDAFPLQGTVEWAGLPIAIDGKVARDGSRFDGEMHAAAEDAGPLLAALGIAAERPGRLDVTARVALTTSEAVAHELAVTLGRSTASGTASIGWAAPRLRMVADLAGERIDVEPFALGGSRSKDETALQSLLEHLDSAAADLDAEVKLTIGELAGAPVTLRELALEGRSRDRVINVHGEAVVAGTRTQVSFDYDARKARRVLAANAEGGRISTAALPSGARPGSVSGATAGLRGQLRAEGTDARGLVTSMKASVEARDLRWSIERNRAPITGRFDLLRVAVHGKDASSAEAKGRLDGAPCALQVSAGGLAQLVDGEPWPLQLTGSCPGERLSAKGQLTYRVRHIDANLAFNVAADHPGPVAKSLGATSASPYPLRAHGTVVLDKDAARAQIAALRLGRSAGSGELEIPLAGDAVPRVQLALTSVDLGELNARTAHADPLEQKVLRKTLRLADVDFRITIDRLAIADASFRRLRFRGAVRSRRMAQAPFRLQWEGLPLRGHVGADFSGAVPRIEIDATTRNADLRPLLARFGKPDIGLRAGALSLQARAEGERLGELLASATLSLAVEQGQLDLVQHEEAEGSHGEFSATLTAAPGKPTAIAARGAFDGEPAELAVDGPGLAELARANAAVPLTLRLMLADAQLDAKGKITRSGESEGQLQLSGGRLDRLGLLLGVDLPDVEPYAASGNFAVSAGRVHLSDLAVSFGRSRLLGELRIERPPGARPFHSAALRLPALHLEDIGAGGWRRKSQLEPGEEPPAPAAGREGAKIDRWFDLLRSADADVTIEIAALHGAGEQFASGRVHALADAGVLRLQLKGLRAAEQRLDADIRVDTTVSPPKFGLHAQGQQLEYGPLMRSMDSASTMAGTFDLVADLSAQGPPEKLLPVLTGTVDAAIYPHDLRSAALGLWGAGLVNGLLRQVDPDARSAVDCAVISFDFGGGAARSSAFFVDATRVRIIGEVAIDLMTRSLSGRIDPVSKQPALLSFAPTMVLGGTVEQPRVSSAPANVVAVPLRFATSLGRFPLDWLASRGRLREGDPSCREAFARIRQGRSGAQ